MNSSASDKVAIAQGRGVDRSVDEFEAAFKRGECPSIATALHGVDESMQRQLFAELLTLELDYRTRRGDGVSLAEYANAWRAYEAEVSAVFQASEIGEAGDELGPTDRSGDQVGPFQLVEKVGYGFVWHGSFALTMRNSIDLSRSRSQRLEL